MNLKSSALKTPIYSNFKQYYYNLRVTNFYLNLYNELDNCHIKISKNQEFKTEHLLSFDFINTLN